MENEDKTNIEKEIDTLIDKISSNDVKRVLEEIIFKRLKVFFEHQGKSIDRTSLLGEVLPPKFTEIDWNKLEQIGFQVPRLEKSKMLWILSVIVILTAFVLVPTFAVKILGVAFTVMEFPVLGIIILTTLPMLILLDRSFKRRHLPCRTVKELIDEIISINWRRLMANERQAYNELLNSDPIPEGNT